MINLREYKKNPDKLSDLLPFAALVDGPKKAVVLNKDGSFMASIKFRGPDLDSATDEELVSMSARVNNVFSRISSSCKS